MAALARRSAHPCTKSPGPAVQPARAGRPSGPAADARGVEVASVRAGFPACRAGLRAGDVIVRIDGAPIHDFLDLYLAAFGRDHTIDVMRAGAPLRLHLRRKAAGDAGMEAVARGLKPCGNRCVFCFVDQLPRGLRRDLYFKDEDYRLSFLHGNYLTLSNLAASDERRIMREHLSPLYVSVHTTDEDVRSRLLGRRPREAISTVLRRLGRQGIRFHAQIVTVPGYNDGGDLERTLRDLRGLGHTVLSVSVVPVGLTAHRRGLTDLRPVGADEARASVDVVAELNGRIRSKTGKGWVYASDEMHILAARPIPEAAYYDDFPQIENGVGLVRQMLDQLRGLRLPAALRGRRVRFATGHLAKPFVDEVARALIRRGLRVDVIAVANSLFGPQVTVSGLLPGDAIIAALKHRPACDAVVLPPDVANAAGVTLDGVTAAAIGAHLRTPVLVADPRLKRTLSDLAALIERN